MIESIALSSSDSDFRETPWCPSKCAAAPDPRSATLLDCVGLSKENEPDLEGALDARGLNSGLKRSANEDNDDECFRVSSV
mmetsp:Transcript_30450/g.63778  ORF Transcript_30450/g.63778 Transcript_30450/m.63778 type:complete len:81 (+) Transcript_30450:1598-1840(+)